MTELAGVKQQSVLEKLRDCLWLLSLVTVIQTMTKSNVERKGFIWLTYSDHSSSQAGSQTGKELEQRPWRNAASWLVHPGLLSLFS